MTPNISVALCTYDGAAFIEEQLRSILGQSLRPVEIVISDDGSVDGSMIVVERVIQAWRAGNADADIGIRLIKNGAPLGVTANFEQALASCTGELVALCDQDDVWVPDRLERMSQEFERRPDLLLLHSDARLVSTDGSPLGLTLFQALNISAFERASVRNGLAIDVLLRRNIVTGATVMVRREFIEFARPFPAPWLHDEWLAMVAAAIGRVDFLAQTLTDYRQHGSNQIGASKVTIREKLARLSEPRGARNWRLLSRASALNARAEVFSPDIRRKIAEKFTHEQFRSGLSDSRMPRLIPIISALLRGSYSRYGLGLRDALRDLVQSV